jgi:hypothetical protein
MDIHEIKEGDIRQIPHHPTLIRKQAEGTIKNILDAIVELVTNSDDSYNRLKGLETRREKFGEIFIQIERAKGNICKSLSVRDYAEGMDFSKLEKSITYGGETSGFTEGKSVRGLFGRGLKEAVIALGVGTIRTFYDGFENEVILRDEKKGPVREVIKKNRKSDEANGTEVLIRIKDKKFSCPTFEKLLNQVTNHYVLREILSKPERKIILKMLNDGGERGKGSGRTEMTKLLQYKSNTGNKIDEKQIELKGFGKTTIELFESDEKLYFQKGDPCSRAGLVVKTVGAVLDLSLFGFESDESAHFFWGYVDCPGIADLIRKGDNRIINSTRTGLYWDYKYCQELHNTVKDFLKPHITRKTNEISKEVHKPPQDKHTKKIKEICALLNKLARIEELIPNKGGDGKYNLRLLQNSFNFTENY